MNIKRTLLAFLLTISIGSFAQKNDFYRTGEMLIQFESKAIFQKFISSPPPALQFKEQVSEHLNLYLFNFQPEEIEGTALSDQLNRHPLIRAAGQNFYVEKRATIPSDEFFNNQQSFDIIQAPDAWDLLTSAPEEVVVAIIEGADVFHEDLDANVWRNPHEIPDDGIDNDNNGFVDDYLGVNVSDSTDTPVIDDHGTKVAGIIGAKGDNGIGVAGVLWDVKMMIISSDLTFSDVVKSYEYVYNTRKRYNDTNGAEGAYIVATNSSFGVDKRFPDQNPIFPVWCEAYNLMGSIGVLSVAATNNSVLNIELEGDMPGLCTSDYLIITTGSNESDELTAAFSRNFVDLSAPDRSFTTDLSNSYSNFNGTSGACPLVTGSVAMLYSYPCAGFEDQAMTQPALTALQVKRIILESVDPIEDLATKTVSGGRLNLFNAVQQLQSEFGAAKGNLGFLKVYPNPVHETLFVEYRTSEATEYEIKIYDAMGRLLQVHLIPEICAPSVIEVPVLNLASGIYYMSIENQNNLESTSFSVH